MWHKIPNSQHFNSSIVHPIKCNRNSSIVFCYPFFNCRLYSVACAWGKCSERRMGRRSGGARVRRRHTPPTLSLSSSPSSAPCNPSPLCQAERDFFVSFYQKKNSIQNLFIRWSLCQKKYIIKRHKKARLLRTSVTSNSLGFCGWILMATCHPLWPSFTLCLYPKTHQSWSFPESLELPNTLQVCVILTTPSTLQNRFYKLPVRWAPSFDEAWSVRKLWGYQLGAHKEVHPTTVPGSNLRYNLRTVSRGAEATLVFAISHRAKAWISFSR